MAKHKVEISNLNTSYIKVLTNDEMIELFKKYKNGDKFAKDELVSGNLKLVLSLIKKYSNKVDNMDDLFQVGCIGLIKAIDNFDLSHDVRFSTYAVPMILGEVKRYLRDNTSVRIARSIKDLCYKIMKLKEEIYVKKGYIPTNKELIEILGISEYEFANALDSMKDSISMFEPIYNEGTDTIYLCDQLNDKKGNYYDQDLKISLNDALNHIKDKEKYILLNRYIYGKTQTELSFELGISQAQISRLEKNAVEDIKRLIL